MRTLNFTCGTDVARRVLGRMGSLAAGHVQWTDLSHALRDTEDPDGILHAADNLVREAVPEEGEIHPQRATIQRSGALAVTFTTPGGVRVRVAPDNPVDDRNRLLNISIDFGRDSRSLSWEILADLAPVLGWVGVIEVDGDTMFVAEAVAAVASRGLAEDMARAQEDEAVRRQQSEVVSTIAASLAGPTIEG